MTKLEEFEKFMQKFNEEELVHDEYNVFLPEAFTALAKLTDKDYEEVYEVNPEILGTLTEVIGMLSGYFVKNGVISADSFTGIHRRILEELVKVEI